MPIEESGNVVEVRGGTALVRLRRSSACTGCAAAGQCHAGHGESEKLLEARNEAGAAVGDVVQVAVSTRAVIGASARIYLVPVVGLLGGAALAQLCASAFLPPQAGEVAPGVGGIAGAVCAVLLSRRRGRGAAAAEASRPWITRVVGPPPALTRRGPEITVAADDKAHDSAGR